MLTWRMKMAEPAPRKMSSRDILEEALKAREQFLKEQPHLQAYQDEIDRILEKTVGFENRMSVLAFMIEKKLYDLRDAIADLRSSAEKVKGFLDEAKIEKAGKIIHHPADSNNYLN